MNAIPETQADSASLTVRDLRIGGILPTTDGIELAACD
jgi:hypothetical protein